MTFIREDHFRQGYEGWARSGYVVVYKLIHEAQVSGCIVAAPEGVRIKGEWPVFTVEEAVQFEEQQRRAIIQAIQLALQPGHPISEEEIDQTLAAVPPYA